MTCGKKKTKTTKLIRRTVKTKIHKANTIYILQQHDMKRCKNNKLNMRYCKRKK